MSSWDPFLHDDGIDGPRGCTRPLLVAAATVAFIAVSIGWGIEVAISAAMVTAGIVLAGWGLWWTWRRGEFDRREFDRREFAGIEQRAQLRRVLGGPGDASDRC